MSANRTLVLFIGAWLGVVTAAAAQSAIAGVVKDTSGAVLPGVGVEVASPALIERTRTAVTDDAGNYKIIDLRPGVYTVTFQLQGFGTVTREGVELPATFTATINAEMKVGSVQETVTVTGASPLVDVQNVTQQSVMSREVLDTIPTGRNVFAQASLVAGVTTNRPDIGGSEGMQSINVQVHGSNGDDLAYQVDGMSVNSNNNGGGTSGLYFNDGMIEEISFQTSAQPAEIGSGGIRMNMIPREGGNNFHGALFASGANHSLQGSNLSDSLRRRGLRAPNGISSIYDVNFSFGGPVQRDRLWFFTTVRRWSSDNLVANTFNLDGTQAVDDNRLSSILGRLTLQASRKNKLSLYYDKQGKYRGHRRPTGTEFVSPEATWVQRSPLGFTTQAKFTSTVSNKVLFESGFSMYYLHWTQEYRPESSSVSVIDFVKSVRTGATSYDFDQWNVRRSYVASVSYVTGSHAFKTGIQFSEGPYRETRNVRDDIVLRFSDGVANSVDTFNSPIDVRQRMNADMGVYAQDSWTVGRLTFNPGLRVDYYDASISKQDAPAGRFIGERHFNAIQHVPQWTNVVPRLAAAYDLFGNGRTAIKASASQYVKNEGMGFTLTGNNMSLSSNRRSWTDQNGDRQAQDNELGASTGFTGGAGTTIDPDLKRPNNWEYTASFQHELLPRLSVSAAYFRRVWYDLYGVKNTLVTSTNYTPVSIANPLTGGPITVYNQNVSTQGLVNLFLSNYDELNTTYNGVELKAERRFSRGANLFGGVTIGTNRGSTRGSNADLNNPNVLINHIGAVGFDSTYQYKVAGVYPLPYGVNVSGALQITSGLPLTRVFTVTRTQVPGLTQVTQAVDLLPAGDVRLPMRQLLDLRFAKIFRTPIGNLEGMADLYNVFNSDATISEVTAVGPSLGQASEVVQGRLLRLGVQWKF
jgi:carboxypeptidase family protein/TonB-dependent receptor-like protein